MSALWSLKGVGESGDEAVWADDEGEVFLVYKPYINGGKSSLKKGGGSSGVGGPYPRRESGPSILSPSNFPPTHSGDNENKAEKWENTSLL